MPSIEKTIKKNCSKIAEWRKNNKEKLIEKQAEYYSKNREKFLNKNLSIIKIIKKKFLNKNLSIIKNNKEKILKQKSEYYSKNREEIAQKNAKYYSKNREEILKQKSEYHSERKAQQPACVYQIVNSANNKIYIGETLQGELRWKKHLTRLRGNYHENPKLQADFDKFGEEAFEWSIIKEVDKDKPTLLLEEIKTINSFLKQGKELYNLSLTIEQLKLLQEDK